MRWKLAVLPLALFLLVPGVGWSQTTLTNGNMVVVGWGNYCADSGSTDAYACSHPTGYQLTTYITGRRQTFLANTANTGAATLALDGLSAIALKVRAGSTKIDPPTGTICAGSKVEVVYDGTDFEIVSLPCSPVITAGNTTAVKTALSLENVNNTADASKAVATAAALAANGANCTVAGTFPNGVDAAGASENCVTLSAVNAQTSTYQALTADFDSYKTITVASGTFTITLVASGTQPANGKYLRIINYGSGVVTIARSGQNLNGGTTSLLLNAGSALDPSSAFVFSDGTNYFAWVVQSVASYAATAKTLTNTTLDVEGTGNVVTTAPKIWMPAVACAGTTGSLLWDTLATLAPTATCSAGTTETTLMRAVADFPDSDGDYSLQQTVSLPGDWTGAIDAVVKYRTTATSGNTVWQLTTACRADAEVDDVAWNTATAFTADAAKGTTNQLNDVSATGIVSTGCTAGELMHVKLFRNRTHASDTMTGVVSLVGLELTLRRAQ